ncbi:MAG: hypothetical protein KDA24_22615 [Deltaproteobacteria bacterium]|nr:hypothetical protein [Deltaproteobacteria bacterium]
MMSLLLPGLFAGLVAVLVTVAIERFGGRVGGLLGTLPTTIVPASLGIFAETDAEGLGHAMYAVPAGMLLNAGFLWLWRAVPPRLPSLPLGPRLAGMTVVSMGAWFAGALGLVMTLSALDGSTMGLRLAGWGATAAIVVVGAVACLRSVPAPKGSRPVGLGTLLARGLLAGLAIATAVWISRVGGPLAAGVASVFPAIFVTTMVSLWLAQGEAVPSGAVGPMMLGSAAVATYALFAAAALPALGPWLGTLVAWVAAVGTTTVPAWWWLGRRAAQAEAVRPRGPASPSR